MKIMSFPANRNNTYKQSGRQFKFAPALRVALMLIEPLMMFAGSIPQQILHAPNVALAGIPNPVVGPIAPPTNLQLLGLDTTIQVNWTPSTDVTTAFHLVSVWEGANL